MENKMLIAETERLILRRYKTEDLQDLFEYLSDEETVKFEPYKPMTFDEAEENLAWRIGTEEMTAVELKESHKMIGNVYYAECDPANERSWKLLEALEFQREAHFRKNVYFWKDEMGKAIWKDTYVYARLKDNA